MPPIPSTVPLMKRFTFFHYTFLLFQILFLFGITYFQMWHTGWNIKLKGKAHQCSIEHSYHLLVSKLYLHYCVLRSRTHLGRAITAVLTQHPTSMSPTIPAFWPLFLTSSTPVIISFFPSLSTHRHGHILVLL